MEEIQKIVNGTLRNLSDYCINECKSFCCRKGYLILRREEVDLVIGAKEKELVKNDDLKEMLNGKYSLNLDNCFGGCPQLREDFKCMIHENQKRPDTCKNFPIFVVGKEIKISSRCPAKRENKFFCFVKEAERLGYRIVEKF
ncbi:MAG: YkgJ family cysteine cluster protein [Candidatus Pacearchaeota archaeon]|nr:YkgJ family cysteine cluster protein [Candidatus Pacearchaeota archaeon]